MPNTLDKAKSFILGREGKTGKQNDEKPYRSKLVVCIDILCALVSKGPMRFTQLSYKVELDTLRLMPHLRLLIDRGLIEQQNLGESEIFYIVTARGLKVLKVVNPIIKEAHKLQMRDLETISNTLSKAGYS
ncbi:MAG: winged helix-turn-helix domain-containing protein [Candidatus Bathyarchaeota archaeon]|jgi:predicted transcriptional regulator